mmetsp:Transcript_19021/g.35320  ORF Transcript_19021/g.35320 Transcript_19021/m.35320 type:complete len:226 (+) Transcript_19021:70-747(+)
MSISSTSHSGPHSGPHSISHSIGHSSSHSSSSTSYSLPTQTSVLLHHTEGTQKRTELLKQGSSVFVKNTAEYPYLAILESLHIKNPSKHVAKKTNSGILTDSECADITVTLRWYFTSRDLPDLGLSSGPTYPLPPSSLSLSLLVDSSHRRHTLPIPLTSSTPPLKKGVQSITLGSSPLNIEGIKRGSLTNAGLLKIHIGEYCVNCVVMVREEGGRLWRRVYSPLE